MVGSGCVFEEELAEFDDGCEVECENKTRVLECP